MSLPVRLGSIMGMALLVVACGTTQGQVPEVANGDPVLLEGRDIYIRNCAQCHGAAGGGGRGARLNGGRVIERFPDQADQIAVVANGKGNMPAFGEKLNAEQIDAVVRFTREILSDE